MLLTCLLALLPALALEAPVGWTALAADRAVLHPADPGRGELRELSVPGTSIDPQLLVSAMGDGVRISGREADGTVSLTMADGRVARARAHSEAARVRWFMVIATARAAESLDADALLTSLIPVARPPTLTGPVEVMPAGRDGSLWDAVGAPAPSQATDLWGNPVSDASSTWGLPTRLVGIWASTTGGPWGGRELIFTLDTTGRLRIEDRGAEGSQVTEGTWEATGEQLRVSSYTAEPTVLPYQLDGQTLELTWQGERLALFPRR
jgi:hypothetical protein